MRRTVPGLAFALALAIATLSLVAAPQTAPSPLSLHASAVSFTLNYSDPASDVAKMWTSNGTHVTDAAGNWILSPSPGTVNLIRLSSSDSGLNVNVFLKVQTTLSVLPNATYEYRLYPRADNASHYVVTFRDGLTTLVSNHTGSATHNLTANTSVGNLGWLGVAVSKNYLGGAANITGWNIDATTRMVAGNYTYEDFVWQQPGNPGSAPAFIQGRVTDAGTSSGLAGVNVSTGTGGYYTTTNSTGYYSLPAAPGTFTLTFALTGYESASKTVTVSYQQTQTANEALTRITPITGQSWFWGLIIVLIVAIVAVAYLVLRRRSKPRPPK